MVRGFSHFVYTREFVGLPDAILEVPGTGGHILLELFEPAGKSAH